MALGTPYFLQAATGQDAIKYDGREMRMPLDAMIEQAGVCGSTHLQVKQRGAGANQSVDILAGYAAVAFDNAFRGKVVVPNYELLNFTGIAAPPVSGTRNDLIALRISDPQTRTADAPNAEIIYQIGSLTRPPNSIRLAQIIRRAGQSSVVMSGSQTDIIDLRDAAGGMPGGGAFCEFYGGNGQRIGRNFPFRYDPDGVRFAQGFIIPNPRQCLVRVTRPGLYSVRGSIPVNTGGGSGSRMLICSRNNTRSGPNLSPRQRVFGFGNHAGYTGQPVAYLGISESIPCKIDDELAVFIVQDGADIVHVNDAGGDAHITFQYEKPLPGLL